MEFDCVASFHQLCADPKKQSDLDHSLHRPVCPKILGYHFFAYRHKIFTIMLLNQTFIKVHIFE